MYDGLLVSFKESRMAPGYGSFFRVHFSKGGKKLNLDQSQTAIHFLSAASIGKSSLPNVF